MSAPDRRQRLEVARDRFNELALNSPILRLMGEARAVAFDLARLHDEGAAKASASILGALGAAESDPVAVARVGDGAPASDALAALAHAVRVDRIEAGQDDLAIGYPWLEGRIADGGEGVLVRAPLFLYPATLEPATSQRGGAVWALGVSGSPWLNEPLCALFRRLGRVRLAYEDFLAHDEDGLFKADDATWQGFVKTLQRGGVTLADTAKSLPERPERFTAETAESLARIPVGQLRLRHHVVLGRFPMLASGIAADYDLILQGTNATVGVDAYALAAGGPLTEVDPEDPGLAPRPNPADAGDKGLFGTMRRWQVLPSDPWQDEATRVLEFVREGGLVVTGATGTGKSQLAANVIAACIARGEKVLMTSTRRAALDDVLDRLVERGLGEPCAVAHDAWRDRASIAQSITESLATFTENGRFEEVEIEAAMAKVRALDKALHERLDAADQAYDVLVGADQRFPGLATLDERMLADKLLSVYPLEQIPDLSDCVDGVSPAEVDRALVEVAFLAADAAPFLSPHPLSLRTDWSELAPADVVGLYSKIEQLRRALKTYAELPGPLAPRELERNRALFAQARVLVALAMADDTPRLVAHGKVRRWLDQTGDRVPTAAHRELVRSLRKAAGSLVELPPELVRVPANELADRIANLEKLSKIETSGLRAVNPAYWSLKKLPEKILASLPDDIDIGTTAEALITAHREAQRWQEVLATLPEAECFELADVGIPELLMDAVVRCEAAFEEAVAEELVVHTLGRSFPDPPDWSNDPPRRVADSHFLTALTQETARAAALGAVQTALTPLDDLFAPTWLGPLRELARDAPLEAERQLAVIAGTREVGEKVAELDRKTARLPGFIGRFLRIYRGPVKYAAAVCRRAVEEGWRTLRLGAWGASAVEAALVDPRELRALGEAMGALQGARAEAALTEWRRRVSLLSELESQRQDLLKIVQETARKRLRATLKQLVDRYWKRGLNVLRPAWFVPLEAVASVFARERDTFDLVIIDEAHSAGLWTALPALIRGKRVLVLGDPSQAPPIGEPSVLALARGAFPGLGLWWGWGVRHEELWAFPQAAAYGGGVVLAPSAERRARGRMEGVGWARVDGRWRDGANKAEADKVVDLIAQALAEPLEGEGEAAVWPSVGVAAMTRAQAELIRERIDRRVAKDEAFRALIERDRTRPEREQLVVGDLFSRPPDVRDIQILSVTFADTEGSRRLQVDFGPLAELDGEGFLLSFVTRARRGFTVVASFADAALDVARVQGLGPKLLHALLVYARGASIKDERLMEEGLAEVAAVTGLEVKLEAPVDPSDPLLGDFIRDELAGPLAERGLGIQTEPPRASGLALGAVRTGLGSGPPPGQMRYGPVPPDLTIAPTQKSAPKVGVQTSRFLREPDALVRDVYARRFWQRLGWTFVRVTPGVWRVSPEGVIRAIEKLFQLTPREFTRALPAPTPELEAVAAELRAEAEARAVAALEAEAHHLEIEAHEAQAEVHEAEAHEAEVEVHEAEVEVHEAEAHEARVEVHEAPAPARPAPSKPAPAVRPMTRPAMPAASVKPATRPALPVTPAPAKVTAPTPSKPALSAAPLPPAPVAPQAPSNVKPTVSPSKPVMPVPAPSPKPAVPMPPAAKAVPLPPSAEPAKSVPLSASAEPAKSVPLSAAKSVPLPLSASKPSVPLPPSSEPAKSVPLPAAKSVPLPAAKSVPLPPLASKPSVPLPPSSEPAKASKPSVPLPPAKASVPLPPSSEPAKASKPSVPLPPAKVSVPLPPSASKPSVPLPPSASKPSVPLPPSSEPAKVSVPLPPSAPKPSMPLPPSAEPPKASVPLPPSAPKPAVPRPPTATSLPATPKPPLPPAAPKPTPPKPEGEG